MAFQSTYTPLATYTVPSAVSNVTFTSISQDYTDLEVVITGSFTTLDAINIRVGSTVLDTGSNYAAVYAYGTNTTFSAGNFQVNQTSGNAGVLGTNISTARIYFGAYSNTNFYKTMINKCGDGATQVKMGSTLWRSNAAINTIQFFSPSSYNFTTGTTFTIYGIASA